MPGDFDLGTVVIMNDAIEVGEYVTCIDELGITVVALPHRPPVITWISSATIAGDVTVKTWSAVEEDLARGAKFFRRAVQGWVRVRNVAELR